MTKKSVSPDFLTPGETAFGERLLLLLGGGFFGGGFFNSFFSGHSFYVLFVSLNFGIVSFSEGDGIMLPSPEFVNGGLSKLPQQVSAGTLLPERGCPSRSGRPCDRRPRISLKRRLASAQAVANHPAVSAARASSAAPVFSRKYS
jgi:hypothetical protein